MVILEHARTMFTAKLTFVVAPCAVRRAHCPCSAAHHCYGKRSTCYGFRSMTGFASLLASPSTSIAPCQSQRCGFSSNAPLHSTARARRLRRALARTHPPVISKTGALDNGGVKSHLNRSGFQDLNAAKTLSPPPLFIERSGLFSVRISTG